MQSTDLGFKFIRNSFFKLAKIDKSVTIECILNILFASRDCEILIIRLTLANNQIKLLHKLTGHSSQIQYIKFLKNDRIIVSVSINESEIFFWKQGLNNQEKSPKKRWMVFKRLEGHSGPINCLTDNKDQNLIVSASQDKTIKFWKKEQDWESTQSIQTQQSSIQSLSLNGIGTKLVCLESDRRVLIIQYINHFWIINQQIDVVVGNLVCFISDDQFVLVSGKFINSYQFKNEDFSKTDDYLKITKFDDGKAAYKIPFFIRYFPSTGLLFIKKGTLIILAKQNSIGKFDIIQQFNFSSNWNCGTTDSHGKLLITQDGSMNKMELFYQRKIS